MASATGKKLAPGVASVSRRELGEPPEVDPLVVAFDHDGIVPGYRIEPFPGLGVGAHGAMDKRQAKRLVRSIVRGSGNWSGCRHRSGGNRHKQICSLHR